MDATHRSEIIKNYAQILAIIVAAAWTLWLFSEKESPSLRPRPTVSAELRWSAGPAPDVCHATYNVSLENSGVSSFAIDRVRVRAWRFPRQGTSPGSEVYYDFTPALTADNGMTDRSYPPAEGTQPALPADAVLPFIGEYPPGQSYHHSFEWEIKRDASQFVYFRIDFYRNFDDKRSAWFVAEWSPVCGTSPSGEAR